MHKVAFVGWILYILETISACVAPKQLSTSEMPQLVVIKFNVGEFVTGTF